MKRVFFFPDFVVCMLCARLRRICRVHAYGFVLVLTAHIKRGGGGWLHLWRDSFGRGPGFFLSSLLAPPREYWRIYRGPGFLMVVWFGSSPSPSLPLPSEARQATHRKSEKEKQLAHGRWGWARSRNIRPQKSLVPYKSFNTLWFHSPLLSDRIVRAFSAT